MTRGIPLPKYGNQYGTEELREILVRLLAPDGCPWDRVQTHESLRKNMIEEAYEAVDAIDSGRPERMADELGDVLLQVFFHAALAERDHEFTLNDITDNLCRKLISRHSHVFGEDTAASPDDVLSVWEKNKNKEKGHTKAAQTLADVPEGLPALMRADKLQKRAAKVGFDWPDASGALDKIFEELREVSEAMTEAELPTEAKIHPETNPEAYSKVEEEVGDLLFATVNYARLIGIDPELALTTANRKFVRRFAAVEQMADESGRELTQMSLADMDVLWDKVKEKERENR